MYKRIKKFAVLTLALAMTVFYFGNVVKTVKAQITEESLDLEETSSKELISKVTPILQSYRKDKSGKTFTLNGETRLVVIPDQETHHLDANKDVLRIFNAELLSKKLINKPLKMEYTTNEHLENSISIRIIENLEHFSFAKIPNQAYRIIISDNSIKIEAPTKESSLYALRTIEHLLQTVKDIPYGLIEDYPQVKERRIHVDAGRKYFSKDWIIQLIREMSYIKMNALQLHFSENKGFRIESEVDPSIVSNEHLTKAEVKEIIAEARKYNIEIIPSFDTPGHVEHILKFHPEYGQASVNGNRSLTGLDVTNREAIDYFKSLYSEYMDLFAGFRSFHIGSDEYMEFDREPFLSQYRPVLSKYAQKTLGSDHNWKDALAIYINEIAELAHSKGFIPRVWNDGLYYGERNDWYDKPQKVKIHDYVEIDFWSSIPWVRQVATLNTLVNKGHNTIYNVNSSFFYYVLRPSKPNDGREQASFDNLNSDRKIYNEWTPGKFSGYTVDDNSEFIQGASLAIWCDAPEIVTEDKVSEDIYNETRALATKSWNTGSNDVLNFDEFKTLYTTLGHAPAYEKGSSLPQVGKFEKNDNLQTLIVHYVDENNQKIAEDNEYYGKVGEKYNIKSIEIYGYKIVGEKEANGTYEKGENEYTFIYEKGFDNSKYEQEIKNQLDKNKYIEATYNNYQEKYYKAKALLEDENSNQEDIVKAFAELEESKRDLVPLNAYPLYIEVTNPLKESDYVSGYKEYSQAIAQANEYMRGAEVSDETVKEQLNRINESKKGLVKKGDIPTITASKGYYQDYNYDNMIDGNLATHAWFESNQTEGDTINFEFAEPVVLNSIRIVEPETVGADVLRNPVIEISLDGEEWEEIGIKPQNETDTTISLDKKEAKYVRIRLTEDANYWYQISEVIFDKEETQSPLELAIKEAMDVDINNKTFESVNDFINKLKIAKEASIAPIGTYTDEEINTIIENLKESILALEEIVEETEKETPEETKEETNKETEKETSEETIREIEKETVRETEKETKEETKKETSTEKPASTNESNKNDTSSKVINVNTGDSGIKLAVVIFLLAGVAYVFISRKKKS